MPDCHIEEIRDAMGRYTSYGLRGMYNEPFTDYGATFEKIKARASLAGYTTRWCETGRTPARKPESEPDTEVGVSPDQLPSHLRSSEEL